MNWDVVFAQNINLCALGKKKKSLFVGNDVDSTWHIL